MAQFTPLVVEERKPRGDHFGRYRFNQGVSILKVDGTYIEVSRPTQKQVAEAEVAYIGGYIYEVDAAEAAALQAAGYTLLALGYGEGAYGAGGYGS